MGFDSYPAVSGAPECCWVYVSDWHLIKELVDLVSWILAIFQTPWTSCTFDHAIFTSILGNDVLIQQNSDHAEALTTALSHLPEITWLVSDKLRM